jgi:hypothetical protein
MSSLLDKSPIPSHHILHLSIDSISLVLIHSATSEDINRETLIAAQFFLRLDRFTESLRVFGEPSHEIEERVIDLYLLTIVMTDAGEGVGHGIAVLHEHGSHNYSFVDVIRAH